jgi:RNA polymerase sigma-70 factor (ECF subfamily)
MKTDTLTSTFIELRGRLTRLALRFLHSQEDAEDVLQDAFMKLWSRRNDISSRTEAEALSVVAVRNQCVDSIRRKHIDTVELDAAKEGCTCENVVDKIERYELFAEVDSIIDGELTEQQRRILRMKEYEDLSIERISGILGMEESAVRMNLSRARKKIRECYQRRHRNEKG